MNTCRTEFTLNLSRFHPRNLIALTTVYWPLGVHARRLRMHNNDFCRSYNGIFPVIVRRFFDTQYVGAKHV